VAPLEGDRSLAPDLARLAQPSVLRELVRAAEEASGEALSLE
jgi:hypothetical protein